MSIDCAFYGFLAADAEARTSKAGKPWTRLRVGVGKDDNLQWVAVAVFGRAAETAAELRKGDRIYCEGSIRLDSWTGADGNERHGLNVAALKIDRTHNIGRNRPKEVSVARGTILPTGRRMRERAAADDDFHNDSLMGI
jgi:single-strand DNA-binding protein